MSKHLWRYGGAVWLLLWCATAMASEGDALQPVERLHGRLLEVMREADQLGFAGRRDSLGPVVVESFDFPYMCQLLLGPHWRELDAAQRTRMVAVFGDLSIATYAARFDGFSGEQFETLNTEPLKLGRQLVRTQLRKANGDTVQLNYIVHSVGSGWKIVNVVAEGVSELSLRRAEYVSIVKKESFDVLLGKLSEQIKRQAKVGD